MANPNTQPLRSPRGEPEASGSFMQDMAKTMTMGLPKIPELESEDFKEHISDAYGTSPHCTFAQVRLMDDREAIQDYQPMKFSSFRVCCACKGTIMLDPILLIEQCIITIIFLAFALPVYIYFKEDMAADRKGAVNVREWLNTQEGKMRAFAKIMTGLAAFLLSFYTSISVTRWWTIRTDGVGGVKSATMDLCMWVSQFCTREEKVLSAIRRYSRASLILVFLWRRGQASDVKQLKAQLTGRQLLDEGEVDKLLKWNHCLHETIWAWQAGIVTMLHKEGKIKSEQLLSLLLERCSNGRAAIQCIHTHCAVRIPMQYVHLLGLLVKMHNLVLAIIMGTLFGAALRDSEVIICFQLFGRTCLLPFLFNAILLINAELSDPFEGNMADFPGTVYEKALEKDGKAFIDATNNLPEWLQKRWKPPPASPP